MALRRCVSSNGTLVNVVRPVFESKATSREQRPSKLQMMQHVILSWTMFLMRLKSRLETCPWRPVILLRYDSPKLSTSISFSQRTAQMQLDLCPQSPRFSPEFLPSNSDLLHLAQKYIANVFLLVLCNLFRLFFCYAFFI